MECNCILESHFILEIVTYVTYGQNNACDKTQAAILIKLTKDSIKSNLIADMMSLKFN